MKTIHIFIHTMNHSGLVHAAIMMANGCAANNIDVKLVVVGRYVNSPYNIDPKIGITYLGAQSGPGLKAKLGYLWQSVIRIRRYIKREKADNLFVWGKEFTSVIVLLRALLCLNVKIVGVNVISILAHLHYNKSPLVRHIHMLVYKLLLKRADHIVAQSRSMTKELRKVFKVKKENINVAYPALSKAFFGLDIASERENEIIFVGRLAHQKNPQRMLKLLAKIKNKDVKLRFLGAGDMLGELEELAAKLSIADRVIFAGAKDNVIPYLQKAKLLVLTSRYEGFGMVLAESIACGTPVVAVDCPVGPSEIVEDGQNGYLVAYKDNKRLVKQIDAALAKDWDYGQVSSTALKFAPEEVLKGYIEAIEKVYGNENGR